MVQQQRPYRFTVIVPTNELARQLTQVACDSHYLISIEHGVLDEAPAIALNALKNDPDVILSRGGTAEYIRNVISTVPVVSIPMTPFDLLCSLLPLRQQYNKVAFFNFSQPLYGTSHVAHALGITIDEYLFETREELQSKMIAAKSHGSELMVGGTLIPLLAAEYGMPGALVDFGADSVRQALQEACNLARERRALSKRNAWLTAILDNVTDGIMVTDAGSRISLMNKAAEKIMGVSFSKVQGVRVDAAIPNTQVERVMETCCAEYGELQHIGTTAIVTNCVPILESGICEGVVCTFTEGTNIQHQELRLRGSLWRHGFSAKYCLDDIWTDDAAMKKMKQLAKLYASTDSTVLIQGESGVGKELFAQGIHAASSRSAGPFVAVNCTTIPENLLESELFGYEEGAFTGAARHGKSGLFEMANHGTLFLDEVGDLPLSFQARLLRVLEEKEIRRVGGRHLLPLNVRIICATNRDLRERIQCGLFREDLFYRLNVLALSIPPLRERYGDAALIGFKRLDQQLSDIASLPALKAALAPRFLAHDWPGNCRELQSMMDRVVLVARASHPSEREVLLNQIWNQRADSPTRKITVELRTQESLKKIMARLEHAVITYYLKVHNHNQTRVAAELGISRMSLWRKMQAQEKERSSEGK